MSRIPFGLLDAGIRLSGVNHEQGDVDGDTENRHDVESDGYMEDDEGDADEEDEAEDEDDDTVSGITRQLSCASLHSPTKPHLRRRIFLDRTRTTATTQDAIGASLLAPP